MRLLHILSHRPLLADHLTIFLHYLGFAGHSAPTSLASSLVSRISSRSKYEQAGSGQERFGENGMRKIEKAREMRKAIVAGWNEGGSSRRDLQRFLGDVSR